MSLTDFADTFLAYPFGLLTSGSVGNNSAGIYYISQSVSEAGATNIGDVFVDTRANAAAYTSGGIGENTRSNLLLSQRIDCNGEILSLLFNLIFYLLYYQVLLEFKDTQSLHGKLFLLKI